MKKIFLRMKNSKIFKSVLVLISGNSLARVFPIIFVPILSRLYGVENFALFGIYNSFVVLLNSFSSGNYEFAVILPKYDGIAKGLQKLSLLICFLFSIILFIILYFISDIVIIYTKSELGKYFIYLLPSSLLINTYLSTLNQWTVRKRYFKVLTISHIVNSLLTSIIQIVFAFFKIYGIGLILGSIIGNILTCAFIQISFFIKEERRYYKTTLRRLNFIMKRYKDFPLYRMPSTILNKVQDSLPLLIFNMYFSSEYIGYYSMAKKILYLPVTVIGRSIGNVFTSYAAKQVNEGKSCLPMYKSFLRILVVLGLIGIGIIFGTIQWLVPIFLGAKWAGIETIIRILCLRLLFAFISTPLSRIFMISDKLKQHFIFQLIQTIGIVSLVYISARYFIEFTAIFLFSIVSSMFKGVYIYLGYNYAKKT